MTERREIIGHARHPTSGPHFDLPAEFVPLRMCIEAQRLHIEVIVPVAIVGRHTEADLRFAYPDVSRRHCRFAFENGRWRVYDLKSLNGIFVNKLPVLEATLFAGDHVRIGCVKLLVESATPLQMVKKAEAERTEKLRQIAELLPANESML